MPSEKDVVSRGVQRARELVDDWQQLRAGVCRRCGAPAAAMKSLCPACADHREVVRRDYQAAAAQRSSASTVRIQHWLELNRWVSNQGYGLREIAGGNNLAAAAWLASSVDLAIATGVIDDDDVAKFDDAAAILPLYRETVAMQRDRLVRAQWFLDLQIGRLPEIPTNALLAAGEVCHLDVPISMYSFADPTRFTPGRLVLTNHRLTLGGRTLPLIDVRRVVPYRGGIVVEPFTDGYFAAHDPQWVVALVNAAVQIARGDLTAKGRREVGPDRTDVFVAAATALQEDDRADDAALVRSLSDQWGHLPPELQVRAQRAAEAVRGTYAVLQHLPPEARTRPGDDGFTPVQNAEVAVDNAMRALSGILLSEYDLHADQLEALRHYTAQWSDGGDLKL